MSDQLTVKQQRQELSASLGIPTQAEPALFPRYENVERRQDTFHEVENNWSEDCPVLINALAHAGFVCKGEGDKVQCYWCGLLLDDWTNGDDPIEIHLKEKPTCQYILKLTEADISTLEDDHEEHSIVQAGSPDVHDEACNTAAQAAIENGFQPRDVSKAVDILKHRRGNRAYSGTDIVTVLYDIGVEPRLGQQTESTFRDDHQNDHIEDLARKELDGCKTCYAAAGKRGVLPCGHLTKNVKKDNRRRTIP